MMLPGLYFLLLSLYSFTNLSVNQNFSISDRTRCLAGFPYIHRDICREKENLKQEELDHKTLWAFSRLTSDAQNKIWESLPSIFKFKSWEELEDEKLNTTLQ